MLSLSFQNPISRIAFAKPKTLRLGAASYETPVWSKVLEMAARAMLENIHYREAALAAVKRFSWMAHSSRGMARPCELEKNLPPSGVLPLLSVRSFVTFPTISGLEWNVYLLEAFLRRASASFAYLSVSAAPRTACGAIVRRSVGFATVTDALARAVVEAGVAANEKEVGDFLIAQRYIQRRRGVEKDVAEAARRISIGSSGNMEGVVP